MSNKPIILRPDTYDRLASSGRHAEKLRSAGEVQVPPGVPFLSTATLLCEAGETYGTRARKIPIPGTSGPIQYRKVYPVQMVTRNPQPSVEDDLETSIGADWYTIGEDGDSSLESPVTGLACTRNAGMVMNPGRRYEGKYLGQYQGFPLYLVTGDYPVYVDGFQNGFAGPTTVAQFDMDDEDNTPGANVTKYLPRAETTIHEPGTYFLTFEGTITVLTDQILSSSFVPDSILASLGIEGETIAPGTGVQTLSGRGFIGALYGDYQAVGSDGFFNSPSNYHVGSGLIRMDERFHTRFLLKLEEVDVPFRIRSYLVFKTSASDQSDPMDPQDITWPGTIHADVSVVALGIPPVQAEICPPLQAVDGDEEHDLEPSFDQSTSTSGPAPFKVTFTDTSTGEIATTGFGVYIDPGDGSPPLLPGIGGTISHTYYFPGTYTPTIHTIAKHDGTEGIGGCAEVAGSAVTVTDYPDTPGARPLQIVFPSFGPTFIDNGGAVTVCYTDTTTYPSGHDYEVYWDWGDGTSTGPLSPGSTPSKDFNDPGSFTITMTVVVDGQFRYSTTGTVITF